ncbi:RNA 2',3'-cyclic phosphodiesterase [Hydrogenovibrio sp. JE_KL2]|uniref:RNA 2',3'-cyclic phosphodiesterase n=1 Tax=Hydrogenovibrio sp. JE_KL2 TaxID=2651188 RepID=UPI00128B8E73|nr:RNA 2',3'-cyclic phosphodiesterase [Hydrogenovibrio sp. JE_KL2]MPQ75699.1 RNA 2',3'-cyclic phosphodiesterase [Hydrogenovibrio sp. JE_KL2]
MRIFIGVEVCDDELKKALLSWQHNAEPFLGERWRMTAPYNFHLTLRFLGQMEASQVENIIKNLPGWVFGCKTLTVRSKGLKLLPSDEKVRVVTLAFENSSALQDLAEKVNAGLMSLGFDAPDLPFLPHITLVRHKGKPLREFDMGGVQWHEDNSVDLAVKTVTVFSSESSLNGVVYRPLFSINF